MALTCAGLGTAGGSASGAPGSVVDIYSSLPLQGASAAQTVPIRNGIRLALAQAGGRAGPFTVRWRSLDEYVARRAYLAVIGSPLVPELLSARLNFAAAVFHPVYGTDWSTLALK